MLISIYIKDQEKFKKMEEYQRDEKSKIFFKIQLKATRTEYNINDITVNRKELILRSNYLTLQSFNPSIVIL